MGSAMVMIDYRETFSAKNTRLGTFARKISNKHLTNQDISNPCYKARSLPGHDGRSNYTGE
jgi:hypothetical protein